MSDSTSADGKRAGRRAGIAVVAFAFTGAVFLLFDPQSLYVWVKALHVIAIIAWMAGMLYLPRLFVYHAGVAIGSEQSQLFKVMEQRLLKLIINPAMVFSWVFGVWLAWFGSHFGEVWFHVKFLAVIGLTGCQGYLGKNVRLFAADQNLRPARHWRMVNEIPTVLMIIIVVMVIVKPF